MEEYFMNELLKIRDLAAQYDISSRTLRYYEEIGIISSIRKDDSQYRFYDEVAVERLEQILLLRKLQLPVKDIQNIFSSQDHRVMVEALVRKLQSVTGEISELQTLRGTIESFLEFLKEKGCSTEGGFKLLKEHSPQLMEIIEKKSDIKIKEEAVKLMSKVSSKLEDVRIIELKPIKVAYYRADGPEPEQKAWEVLDGFIKEKGLDKISTTRYFGFNNPNPTEENPVYGYEVWVTIPEGCKVKAPMHTKDFGGGLYAVIATYLQDIGEKWNRLGTWVQESDEYEIGEHQWLEETVSPYGAPFDKLQMDLYCPIK
jgi:DNA-binding transcriptional MerR regulator/DNA gyrase inhibitor GyrI